MAYSFEIAIFKLFFVQKKQKEKKVSPEKNFAK